MTAFDAPPASQPAVLSTGHSATPSITLPPLPDEAAVLELLFRLTFRRLGACPGCQSTTTRFYKLRTRKAFICQRCGHKIYPCANTFLHKSSTSLAKWLRAMQLLSLTRGKITARQLGADLQVTYKCAWRIRDRLRSATRSGLPDAAVANSSAPDYPALLDAFVFAALPAADKPVPLSGPAHLALPLSVVARGGAAKAAVVDSTQGVLHAA
jgi:Transposase zinc-ribbon domain